MMNQAMNLLPVIVFAVIGFGWLLNRSPGGDYSFPSQPPYAQPSYPSHPLDRFRQDAYAQPQGAERLIPETPSQGQFSDSLTPQQCQAHKENGWRGIDVIPPECLSQSTPSRPSISQPW